MTFQLDRLIQKGQIQLDIVTRVRDFSEKLEHIFIFGAGAYAAGMMDMLMDEEIQITGVVVSRKSGANFLDIPVQEIDEIDYAPNECGFILALNSTYHPEVKRMLARHGYKNLLTVGDGDLKKIRMQYDTLSEELLYKYRRFLPKKIDGRPIVMDQILVIRLDGIGDVVLTSSFLRELRRNFPSSKITLIVSPASFNLVEHCPYVNKVASYDYISAAKYTLRWRIKLVKQFMDEVLLGGFDMTIIPRFDTDYYDASFLSLFSGAKFSVAYSEKVRPLKSYYNKNYDKLFSMTVFADGVRHELCRNLDLLRRIGCFVCDRRLELWETCEDWAIANDFLKKCRGNKLVCVGIGASQDRKKWKKEYFIQLLDYIHQWDESIFFVFVGGKTETKDAIYISERLQDAYILDTTGKMSLRELGAFMRHTIMYIGNDTGAMHIAAAAGCRILGLSRFPQNGDVESTASHLRFGPCSMYATVLQPKGGELDDDEEYSDCINQITVSEVFEAAKKLINCTGFD